MNQSINTDSKNSKEPTNTMIKKKRWGLDRNNVLRPTPGYPWGVEQHHWNTGAKKTNNNKKKKNNSWTPVDQATDKKLRFTN